MWTPVRRAVDDATAAIKSAQQRFDTFAASTYVNGPSSSYLTAADPADIIDTAAAGQTLAASSQQVVADLQRARTEQVNKESAARLAKQKADQAAADAQSSQDAAVSALTSAQQTFARPAGRARPADRRAHRRPGEAGRGPHMVRIGDGDSRNPLHRWSNPSGGLGSRTRRACAAPAAGNWDSQPVGSDPAGDPERVRQRRSDRDHQLGARHSSTSAQYTADMGRNFLRKMGILPTPTATPTAPFPASTAGRPPSTSSKRAGSQMGVPYSWGGGNAAGPSNGIDSGANTVGFDCSGLILYAFAGVGIKLPHYSGSQYDMGRKIPSSQMRRGDVIFYGPGGSQHVTLYLGNGQMLEAPFTGSAGQGFAGADQRHDPLRHPVHRILMRVIFLNFMRHNALRCARIAVPLLAALALLIGLAVPAAAAPDDGQWDPTLPKLLSAGAPGDPVAIANASFEATQMAMQTTQSLGQKFLQSIGLGGSSGGASTGSVGVGRVRGPQAIEYVIRRGASQMGVPYSWGGGTPSGPSTGVDSGANIVGYDCSGFTRFAFAGVGVLIPKYSGDQYNTGRKVPQSQAKRGDLLFWGPGGSQHVAIFLGGGKMLEASGSAGKVTVSPLRTSGLQPYLARMIES